MSFLGSATHIISPVEDRGSGACKAGEAGCQDLTEGRDGGVTQESQTTREHRTCTDVPLSIHFHVGREGLPKMGSWSPFWQHKLFFPAAQLLLDPGGSQWRSLARRDRPSSPASPWMVPSHCCSTQPVFLFFRGIEGSAVQTPYYLKKEYSAFTTSAEEQ